MKIQPDDPLRLRARALGLYGLVARWSEVSQEPWPARVVEICHRYPSRSTRGV